MYRVCTFDDDVTFRVDPDAVKSKSKVVGVQRGNSDCGYILCRVMSPGIDVLTKTKHINVC